MPSSNPGEITEDVTYRTRDHARDVITRCGTADLARPTYSLLVSLVCRGVLQTQKVGEYTLAQEARAHWLLAHP